MVRIPNTTRVFNTHARVVPSYLSLQRPQDFKLDRKQRFRMVLFVEHWAIFGPKKVLAFPSFILIKFAQQL